MGQQPTSMVHEPIVRVRRGAPPLSGLLAPCFLGYLTLSLLLSVTAASAVTDIQGGPEDVRVQVRDATILEILNALKTRFKFTYKAHAYNPEPVTGVYSGTLREALTRILDGNNYVLTSSERGLELLVLGGAGQSENAAPSSTRGGAPNPNPSLSNSPPPLSKFVP